MDIVKEIGVPATLGQLAEECCELGKAALKLQRILMGQNPTPVTEYQASADLLEEATDVVDCLSLLAQSGFRTYNMQQSSMKMDRWEQRIKEAKHSNGEA